MTFYGKKKQLISLGVLLFFVIYGSFAYWYWHTNRENDAEQIRIHAEIISYDAWNLDTTGMRSYLQLVQKTEYYKEIGVIIGKNISILVDGHSSLSDIDSVLARLKIIQVRNHSAPIVYHGEIIGLIHGQKLVRDIYPLITAFFLQFFLVLTAIFIIYLSINRRLLKQQVFERTKRYHELVNLLPEMVFETDAEGTIVFANAIAINRFGLADLSTSVHNFFDLLDMKPAEKDVIDLESITSGREQEKNEYTVHASDGSSFSVLIKAAAILRNDTVTGARIVMVDITERLALEEQLNRDRKMKSIGMMAGGVAHDLNNILSGLINYPELMQHQLPEDSPLHKYIKPMKDAGLRAAEVVADLLMVARGVAAPRSVANLNDLIHEYVASPEFKNLQEQYPDFTYSLELDPHLHNISCSIIHIRKCLMNLVVNGVEAMSGIGNITLATSVEDIDILETPYGKIRKGVYSVLSVHDSGKGIPAYELEHIFEPFYSKKELGRSGTGLGLAVVWNVVQDHNGGLGVSAGESGTVFTLYFPCTKREAALPEVELSQKAYRGQGETVLIVDDELQQRDIATQFLKSFGYTPYSVSSGEEAIEFLKKQRVDLLLLDMVMGAGLNGRQTYEQVMKIHPGIKAIIISGFSESDDVKTTLQLGAGKLLNKPYTKENLAEAVYLELHR
ncbi:hybrid sensor histidine kinase/response regulator [Desulfosediminicola flagellatus]|uniref:hybrid sensor histidine kinase/response regulator n=1 Tax=Desulfosediminicola flagellatus TaxID=2569541 RepID=UPI0010ABF926|nr:PAS domain-containing sensor histidine kinase [Desulfosediminicola flagellatus]